MSQALVKQTIAVNPRSLQLYEDLGNKMQADFDRLQPVFRQMFALQNQILETYRPIFENINVIVQTVKPMLEATRPILEAVARMQAVAKMVTPIVEAPVVPDYIYSATPHRIRHVEPIIDIFPNPVVALPGGAKWDHVECRFKDGHTLSVLYKGKLIGDFDHETLGFSRRNTKERKPDKQWQLLQQLSIFYESDAGLKPIIANLIEHPAKNKESCHKIKQSLVNKLKSAFGIADNPFLSYDDLLGYQIKFKLRPEPDLRGNGELYPSGSRFFDETTDLSED